MVALRVDNVTPVETLAMPQSVEAEAALLGALMIDNRLVDAIADTLAPEHFFEPLHGRIFSAIVRECAAGRSANPITLRAMFADDVGLKEVGGLAYLAQLTGSGAQLVGARDFAHQIRDLAMRRSLIGGLVDVISHARDSNENLSLSVAEAEAVLAEVSDDGDGIEEIGAGKAAIRVINNLDEDRHRGVRSGLGALDATLGAIQPKDLVILASRPGMGKTATAISYAIGAAKRGHGVLLISIEMSSDQLVERALADMCFDDERRRVPFNAITSGNVSQEQGRALARAAEELEALPFVIIDANTATTGKISRLIKRHKRRFAARGQSLELVIVDYLQLVRPDHRERDRYAAISEVSLGLKQAAKTNGLGIMALCQLSREVEKRADKRPMLSDLRDSGQIEQDADSVCFLLRPEYYLAQAKPESEEQIAIWEQACANVRCVIEFIVPKRRRGVSGNGRGAFYGAYQAVR